MKQQDDDKLKNLFQRMEQVGPSFGFEDRLMKQVAVEAESKAKRSRLYNTLWLSLGLSAIMGLTVFFFLYMDLSFPFPQIEIKGAESLFLSLNFNYSIVALAVIALLLLMGDTLIRKRIEGKNAKK